MEFIESERGNQKLKIKLKTICGGQLSGGYCPAPSFSYERTTGISPSFFEDQFCKVIKLNWKIIKLYLKIIRESYFYHSLSKLYNPFDD
jgi:hypothetical protein